MRTAFGDIQTRDRLLLRHARGPLGGLALVLLCCTVYLPGFFSIPPVDRDESRFAQASRQMFESVALPEAQRDPDLHSGGLAVPRVGGKDRLNKPPLIYWLQAGSAAVFTGGDPLDDAIWMYRVPSFLAGIIIVLATWRLGCSMFDPRAGWLAGVLLAVSPVFVWEAHQARADMVMVAFTTLAMAQLWRIWRTTRGGAFQAPLSAALLLWLYTTLGILTKGPITPLVVILTALTLAVFGRNFHWLRATRPLLGLLLITLGLAPWVYAVAQQVGFAHYWSIIYDEVFGRAGSAKEGHWGPPGYHLVLLVVLFWPGSLLTGLSIARAWRKGFQQSRERKRPVGSVASTGESHKSAPPTGRLRSRLFGFWTSLVSLRLTRRPEAFLLAWLLPSWIVFELVSTKLPHYTMPMYPAVALLTARGLLALPGLGPEHQRRARLGAWLWLAIGVAIFLAVGWGVFTQTGVRHQSQGFAAMLIAVVLLGMVIVSLLRRLLFDAQGWAIGTGVALLLAFLLGIAPAFFGLSKRADRLARYYADGAAVTWVGFREDSVVWLSRGKPSYTEPDDLEAWFLANPDGIAIVSKEAGANIQMPPEIELFKRYPGMHYTKGRKETLSLFGRRRQ